MSIHSKIDFWANDFGNHYLQRNRRTPDEIDEMCIRSLGFTRTGIFEKALNAAHPKYILEIGCNMGQNFPFLYNLSKDASIFGIEINQKAASIAKNNFHNANVICSTGFNLPFYSGSFDFVFTSGVLIHIHPNDLNLVIDEMWRVSKKYIFGMEYHSDFLEHVRYHGLDGLLWKQDFEKTFKTKFSNAKTVFSDIYDYSEETFSKKGLQYKVYLIEKANNNI